MNKMERKSGNHQYHVPVLLRQSVDGLITNRSGVYVDATFGGGGHSSEILNQLSDTGKLFAFDQDEEAHQNAFIDERFQLIKSNFKFFENYLKFYQVLPIDGILADIGVSSHHFDAAKRGFSIRFDEPLDMRMDKNSTINAQIILNEWDEKKIADILFHYGELKNSRLLASKIVKYRSDKNIETPNDLRLALKGSVKPHLEKSMLVQLFQAIRIEVNDELEALKGLLLSSISSIKTGGKLVVISYHSLEDRIVKNFMRSGNFEGKIEKDLFGNIKSPFEPTSSKPIMPDEEELNLNPRSRSARLRIAIKK